MIHKFKSEAEAEAFFSSLPITTEARICCCDGYFNAVAIAASDSTPPTQGSPATSEPQRR